MPVRATRVDPVAVVSGMVSTAVRSPVYQGLKPTVTVQVPPGTTVTPLQRSSHTSNSGKASGSVGSGTMALPNVTGTVPVTETTTSFSTKVARSASPRSAKAG